MDFFDAALKYFQQGTPAGVAVAIVILAVGIYLRIRGFIAVGTSDRKIVPTQDLVAMAGKLDKLDERLGKVEDEVKESATRREVHDLELTISRFDGRMTGIEATLRATNASVGRIEDFMLMASQEAKLARRRGE